MPASGNVFGLQIADLVSIDEPKPPDVAGWQLLCGAGRYAARISPGVSHIAMEADVVSYRTRVSPGVSHMAVPAAAGAIGLRIADQVEVV